MYKLKFTLLQQDILEFLSMNAGLPFNARRLAQRLDVSQTAIAKSLPFLEKEDFIKLQKDPESGRLAIEVKTENPKVLHLKRTQNLRFIYESGLADFLKQKFPGSKIFLYGSYSKGKDIFSSMIDIAIIGQKKSLNLKNFVKILGKKINLIFYNSINRIDKEILSEGIEL